jgi:hypothetical protein
VNGREVRLAANLLAWVQLAEGAISHGVRERSPFLIGCVPTELPTVEKSPTSNPHTTALNTLTHRDQVDPLGLWLERAHAWAPKLELSLGAIERTAAVLRETFGDPWLITEVAKARRRSDKLSHPVVNALSFTGRQDIVELVDLTAYLQMLSQFRGSATFCT